MPSVSAVRLNSQHYLFFKSAATQLGDSVGLKTGDAPGLQSQGQQIQDVMTNSLSLNFFFTNSLEKQLKVLYDMYLLLKVRTAGTHNSPKINLFVTSSFSSVPCPHSVPHILVH